MCRLSFDRWVQLRRDVLDADRDPEMSPVRSPYQYGEGTWRAPLTEVARQEPLPGYLRRALPALRCVELHVDPAEPVHRRPDVPGRVASLEWRLLDGHDGDRPGEARSNVPRHA